MSVTRPPAGTTGTIYILEAPDGAGGTQQVELARQNEVAALKESLRWIASNIALTDVGVVATLHVIYENAAGDDESKRLGQIDMRLRR